MFSKIIISLLFNYILYFLFTFKIINRTNVTLKQIIKLLNQIIENLLMTEEFSIILEI
jgi:hypothetical protein